MAEIVLRLRLIGGDRVDVTYEEAGDGDVGEVVDRPISTLADDTGALRRRHAVGWWSYSGGASPRWKSRRVVQSCDRHTDWPDVWRLNRPRL